MSERLTYTIPEVAELLGISRSAAYACVRRGEIPALALGSRRVVPRAGLEALLANAGAVRNSSDAEAHSELVRR
jgi:excisionase family DNA binding protein